MVTTKKAKEGKVQVDYSGSVTAKFIGLSPDLMNIGEWASAVIDARTNDGYTEDDTWLRYAKLALAYKNQYINLDHTANPFGTGAFTDVADFVFFDAFILREAFFFIVFQSGSNEIIRHTVQSLHSVIEWQGRTRRLTITRKRAIILSKKGFGKRIL